MKPLQAVLTRLFLRFCVGSILTWIVMGADVEAKSLRTASQFDDPSRSSPTSLLSLITLLSQTHSFTYYLCPGGSRLSNLDDQSTAGTSYAWTPSLLLSSASIANPVIEPGPQRTYIRRAESVSGFVHYDTIQIFIREKNALLFASMDSVCEKVPVIYGIVPDAEESQHFLWNVATASGSVRGSIVSGQQSNAITVMWTGEGSGLVQLRVDYPESGCIASGQSIVPVSGNNNPKISAPSSVICQSNPIMLDASDGYTAYLWSTGEKGRFLSVHEAGVYSVITTTRSGCTVQSDAVTIGVSQYAAPVISGADELCVGSSVVLSASRGFAAYQWSTGENTQFISVDKTGSYTVLTIDEYGCERRSDEHRLRSPKNSFECGSDVKADVSESDVFTRKEVILHNSGSETVVVSGFAFQKGSEMRIDNQQLQFPLAVKAGETLHVGVEVQTSLVGTYTDELVVDIASPCAHSEEYAIVTSVSVPKSLLHLSASNTVLQSCGALVEYPLTLEVTRADLALQSISTVHAALHWSANIFEPLSIDGAVMKSSRIENGQRFVEIAWTIHNQKRGINIETVVKGRALASPSHETPVTVDTMWWNQDPVSVETSSSNGSIFVKQACFPTPVQVMNQTHGSFDVQPNPSINSASFILQPVESGWYLIRIFTLSGQQMFEQSINVGNTQKQNIDVDVSSYDDGLYQVSIATPSEVLHQLLSVIK